MEYNTQRPQLKITGYGRNIHKLIRYVQGVEDRERRSRMAAAIVDMMSRVDPDPKDASNGKRKYWVHLMILSEWQLDVDTPFAIEPGETVEFAPQPVPYSQSEPKYRHYGSVMEKMVARVAEYPEGAERDALVSMLAHAMKRDYLVWNRDTVENEVITEQLERLSGGRIRVGEDFCFLDSGEYVKGMDEGGRSSSHKKRKKRKK